MSYQSTEEEIAQDLEDYADAFYDHLADLCRQKHQLDKEIGYRKNTIEKLKRKNIELQNEKEQLEKNYCSTEENHKRRRIHTVEFYYRVR